MIRLAGCALLLLLGGCAHLDRDRDQDDQERKGVPHVTLVLCLFSSCHHIAHPEGGPSDYPEPE